MKKTILISTLLIISGLLSFSYLSSSNVKNPVNKSLNVEQNDESRFFTGEINWAEEGESVVITLEGNVKVGGEANSLQLREYPRNLVEVRGATPDGKLLVYIHRDVCTSYNIYDGVINFSLFMGYNTWGAVRIQMYNCSVGE